MKRILLLLIFAFACPICFAQNDEQTSEKFNGQDTTLCSMQFAVPTVESYMERAKKGDPLAQYMLGRFSYSGRGGAEQNYKTAVKWYRKAAKSFGAAQAELGLCYQEGTGVHANIKKAIKWYRKAVAQDYYKAQYRLALCYEKGEGVPQDDEKAFLLLKKSAQSKYTALTHPEIIRRLGEYYEEGKGIDKNIEEAVRLFIKAAKYEYAWRRTGDLFYEGEPIPQDYGRAVKLYQEAAAKNSGLDACVKLGDMFYIGDVVPQDYARALNWYLIAVDRGCTTIFDRIAYMYDKGLGTEQDMAEAEKWYRKTADNGSEPAKEAVRRDNPISKIEDEKDVIVVP